MEIKKDTTSCWKSKDNSIGTVEIKIPCPICKVRGQEVKIKTVKHFVLDSLINKIHIGKYFICLNEDCDVVYFNQRNVIFGTKDMKTPIWYKKDAVPKYICYCNEVTEQQIIDAVLLKEAKTIKDIVRITGAMKNAKCSINNPLSKCCSPVIQDTINRALILKGEISNNIWYSIYRYLTCSLEYDWRSK